MKSEIAAVQVINVFGIRREECAADNNILADSSIKTHRHRGVRLDIKGSY